MAQPIAANRIATDLQKDATWRMSNKSTERRSASIRLSEIVKKGSGTRDIMTIPTKKTRINMGFLSSIFNSVFSPACANDAASDAYCAPLDISATPDVSTACWESCDTTPHFMVNPASGLPMMDDIFDVAGNTFGTDMSHQFDSFHHSDPCTHVDSFRACESSFPMVETETWHNPDMF